MIDWAAADFLLTCMGILPFYYILWAGDGLDWIFDRAKKNRWGIAKIQRAIGKHSDKPRWKIDEE